VSPLRAAIVGFGLLSLLGAAVGLTLGAPFGSVVAPLAIGLLLLIGTLAEQRRYKKLEDGSPGPGWRMTEERFLDPGSGALVTVYHHDRTGERRYVRLPVPPLR
jgi:hypothetical protein